MITALACLTAAVYFEARSEPVDAQLAVAEVIINRSNHDGFPSTVCKVVKEHRAPVSRPWACQFSFYCDGKSDRPQDSAAWATAQQVASQALSGDILGHGAVYYHTTAVKPVWRHDLTAVGVIGGHVFYTDGRCYLPTCSLRPQARPAEGV
jgi:spore germination cell wall hydrolase CwlJ-like protein